MKAEHWIDESQPDGIEETLFPATLPAEQRAEYAGAAARLCCTIEGEDWDAIMAAFHQHMGWEPYRRAEEAG
jgi:hypothetical protein